MNASRGSAAIPAGRGAGARPAPSLRTRVLADEIIPSGTLALAVAITVTVAALASSRIIHPPAISTSVVFAYRPHDASALLTFTLTLAVTIALAAVYLLLRHVIAPRRWTHLFGLDDDARS